MPRRWSSRELDMLKAKYPTVPTRDLAERLGRSVKSVQMQALRLGLKKMGRPGYAFPESQRTYDHNPTVFEHLDRESAYALGFILADGAVKDGRLTLSNTNPLILAKIRNALGFSHPLRLQAKHEHKWFFIDITNTGLSRKLEELGVHQNKSLTAVMPDVPDHLFWHFLRGYFDGDGSARYSYRGGLQVKFTSGSPRLLSEISARISHLLGIPAAPVVHDKGRPSACRLYYNGPSAALIGKAMYQECGDLYIPSKRRAFDEYESRPTKKEKLADHDVLEIRRLHAETGESYASLARHYGVSPSLVSLIVRGRRRQNVQD